MNAAARDNGRSRLAGLCALLVAVVAYWQARGVWITLHHRVDRIDYKAGALKEALTQTPAEYVAVFDADFLPPADWLRKALYPYMQPGGEKIGIVQTRWTHLNDDYSLLTRSQALALDGHFGVEQETCHQHGLFVNLNGTAGLIRRGCLEEVGNWRGATLIEDMDLSYRAQLQGWRVFFLNNVTAPAEIPGLMLGFKRQQFRWAKGSIQFLRLLGGDIRNR